MNTVNAVLTEFTNYLLAPFKATPLVGLLVWSSVAGVVMTYVFGKTSNQRALQRAADRVRAQLLAVKLFKDDLAVTLQCQIALMKATGMRLVHSLPPMAVMIVPFVLVLTQFALRYEYRALRPGESAIVTMNVASTAWDQYRDIQLHVSNDFIRETKPLRDSASNSLLWRIRAKGAEPTTLRWQVGNQTVEKELSMSASIDRIQPTSARRAGAGFFDRVLFPGEPGFGAASPVKSIEIRYPQRTTPVFGMNVPWWATFFIVSMLVALLVGRFIGVQF